MKQYTDKALSLMLAPRHREPLLDADLVGIAGEPGGHALYKLYLKLGAGDKIERASYDYKGSACSVASTEVLVELIRGRSLAMCAEIREDHLESALDGALPEDRAGFRIYGLEALRDAIRQRLSDNPAGPTLICSCMTVDEPTILEAIHAGHSTVMALRHATKAGTGCGSCMPDLDRLLKRESRRITAQQRSQRLDARCEALPPAIAMRLRAIDAAIDTDVRPSLAKDGGDIEVLALHGHELHVHLTGACRTCASSAATLQHFVEERLRESIDPQLVVVDVPQPVELCEPAMEDAPHSRSA